jgi:succinate CoA transferase
MSSTTFARLTADEAAALIPHGATVAFSGFTPSGAAKVVPEALARKATDLHSRNEPYKIRVLTGASTGRKLDDALAGAEAIAWRAPYQSSRLLREQVNKGQVEFVDMHLSHLPQAVSYGFFGKIDFAVVEATDVSGDGRIYLSTSIGAAPTFLHCAEKIVLELNRYHSVRLSEMADIMLLNPPPHRACIPIHDAITKIGWPYMSVDPKKIVGIVENNEPDDVAAFDPPDDCSKRIAERVVRFLLDERKAGRIPKEFLPLQAGVGNVANAVMACLGANADVPNFMMYTEVFQDSLVDLTLEGKILAASATSLTVTPGQLQKIYENMDFFVPRIVLRPQELSNHPEVIRRLGVVGMNTAIEVDIYGHANSTHVSGTHLMNGIGGSGDFTRNSYLSVFMCPSTAKGGKISTIVPMATHVDHNEHSVQVVVTDQGLADLRGLGPTERAHKIINNCAHPAYRDYLNKYLERAKVGHIRHDLSTCFELHRNLAEQGAMLPGVELKGCGN